MKTFYFRVTALTVSLATLFCLVSTPSFSQFQMNFGTSFDNAFSQVIQNGAEYYVLGHDEPGAGALPHATVTCLDANGQHIWTLTMDISSVWNDAVLVPGGDLLVVGSTLPLDQNSESLMARVTKAGGGSFSWLRRYNEQGRDAFHRIVENPMPEKPAFPYYILGLQDQPGPLPPLSDVVLLNVDDSGTFNWKKWISTIGDDQWSRDLEALANGDLLLAGNDANGVIFKTDNTGIVIGGVQVPQIYFIDVARETAGGIYAAANSFNNDEAFILKFDQDLLLQWDVKIPELRTVSQVWEGMPGDIYATGVGTFGGQARTVIVKLLDNGPTVDWVKYLHAGSNFTRGSSWHLPPNELAFTDARVLSGGFGGLCAFISVSDLELQTCMVSDTTANLVFIDPLPDGPTFPFTEAFPLPVGVDFPGFPLMWLQDTVCINDTCSVAISFNLIDNCSRVEVCANPTGPGPYTYLWCDGRIDSCFSADLSCGDHTFCVSVTCSDGTVATDSATIVISDTVPPIANCVSGVVVQLDANCRAIVTVADIDENSTDNCRIDSMSINPNTFLQCGEFDVTLTVIDWCGNQDTCSTTVTAEDKIPPVITCPPNVQVACDDDILPGTTGTATATDNCDPSPQIAYFDTAQGQFPCDGVIQRMWEATDKCGNISTCVQNVLVSDNVPPVLTNCPPDISVTGTFNAAGLCEADVQLTNPSATDNCDTSLVLTNSFNNTGNASGLYPAGMTTVVWTVRDDCGNEDTCSFVVTVGCDTPMADSICGKSVATCYAQFPGAAVGVIYDTRYNSSAPVGDDWAGVSSPVTAIHPPGWVEDSIGQVFGIALDTTGQIYLAATDVYRYDFSFFNAGSGPGGTAGVYKTDINNPAVTNAIVFTSATTNLTPVAGNMLPNTGGLGNGIGNLAYDQQNEQLFLTNLEDGRIYRVSPSGTLLSSYDPFSLNDGIPGIEKPAERIWGIAVYNQRVYFAREESLTNTKQIWSVGLNGVGEFLGSETVAGSKGFTGVDQLEIDNAPGIQKKYTDLAIARDGRMSLAERGDPHSAAVYEFKTPGAWVFNQLYYVGGGAGKNSAGGVDYFNREVNGDISAGCDSMIWATGNCMAAQAIGGVGGCDVYGMEGISTSGNSLFPPNANTDIFIDFDQNYVGQQKFQIGDVEVFKCACRSAGPAIPCDSLTVSKHPWDQGNCCYSVDFGIHAGPIAFMEVESLTPGVNFSSAVLGPGVMWTNGSPTSTMLAIKHDTASAFPQNDYPGALNFCLSNILTPAQDTQCVVFRWWAFGPTDIPYVACTDTCYFYCDPPIQDTCLAVVQDSVFCNPDNPYEYCMNLTVQNNSGTPGFFADQLILNSCEPSLEFKPCGSPLPFTSPSIALNIVPPIGPGQSNTTPLCTKIVTATPITTPTQFCFDIGLSASDTCCNNSVKHCVTLLPCCDPCENTAVVVHATNSDSCCFSLDITNDCKFNFFTGIQVVLNTPGVIFGSHYTGGPNSGDWYTSPSTNNLIEWHHIQKYVPQGTINGLINFCLDEIDDPSEVPQSVTINWLTLGADGKDSIACDTTLMFDCEPVDQGCIEVVSDTVKCHKDLNGDTYYEYCLTFINNSTPPHLANQLVFTPIGLPVVNPFPNPVLFPNLAAGDTATVNTYFTSTGLNPGDKLTYEVRLHDASFPNGDDWCCFEGDTICIFIPTCDTCDCGTYSDLTYRPFQGAPNIPIACGDTLVAQCDGAIPWTLGGNFSCEGSSCPDSTQMSWMLMGPNGSVSTDSMVATPGFSITIPSTDFNETGCYQLTLKAICGQDTCYCDFVVKVACDTCCTDFDAFCQNVENAIAITVDNDSCKATLSVGDLPSCDYIEYVDWGVPGQVSQGPFYPGDMPMNVYSGSGTYEVCYLAIEVDAAGAICFEKLICDSISLDCKPCCTDFDTFCQNVKNAVTIYTVDFDSCKAVLNVGNLSACDYIDYVDWGDGTQDGTDLMSGGMAMHNYPGSGTYEVCYLAVEADAAGAICFEKLICDSITLDCQPCCTDFDAFCANVESAISIAVDNDSCKATLSIGDLGGCNDYIEYVDWGIQGQISQGPFHPGDMPMNLYPGSGTYTVCYLAIEADAAGAICFEKLICDTIDLDCNPCCTDFNAFCANVESAISIAVDNDSCKATLSIGDLGGCNDYIEYVDWGIQGQISQGPFNSGDMPMNVYPGSGTYTVCYLAIELDTAGFICFEKLICDTIDLDCNPCCPGFDDIISNAFTLIVDNDTCKATLQIGNLDSCGIFVEYVDWGNNQIDNGPFVSGDMPMNVYPGGGTYVVSWLVTELDPSGNVCFEKIVSDSITLLCAVGCQCDSLEAAVDQGFDAVAVSATVYQFQPLGLLDACDSVTWHWGDNSADGFSEGNNAIEHSFPNSIPYDVCMEVQRLDDNGLVCVDSFCLDITATHFLDLENSIRLFPNPTSGNLTLEFTGAQPKTSAVQIFDIYGRLLGRETLPMGQRTHQLSLSAMPAGMYFVQVLDGGVPVWAEKVVKQ